METFECQSCFYWHKCPGCASDSNGAGWCKVDQAFTSARFSCDQGIDAKTHKPYILQPSKGIRYESKTNDTHDEGNYELCIQYDPETVFSQRGRNFPL